MLRLMLCLCLVCLAGCNSGTGSESGSGTLEPIGHYQAMTSGTTDALLLHLDELDNRFRNTSEPSPAQARAAIAAYNAAFLATSDAVLQRDNLLPQQAAKAAQAAISILAPRSDEDPAAYEQLISVCDDVLKRFPNTQAATIAAFAKANAYGTAPDSRFESLDKRLDLFVPAVVTLVRNDPPHPKAIELAMELSRQAENMGRNADALALHRALVDKFSSEPKIQESVNRVKRLEQMDTPLEDFKGKDLAGQDVDLSQFKGKYVLVDFWGTWCEACDAALPHLKRMRQKYAEKGFEILGVDTDPGVEIVRKYMERKGVDWPQIHEPVNDDPASLQGRMGVAFFPTYLIINPEGKLVGSTNEGYAAEEQLDRLMGIVSRRKARLDKKDDATKPVAAPK